MSFWAFEHSTCMWCDITDVCYFQCIVNFAIIEFIKLLEILFLMLLPKPLQIRGGYVSKGNNSKIRKG